jgi:hypothetical protein
VLLERAISHEQILIGSKITRMAAKLMIGCGDTIAQRIVYQVRL